MVVSPRDLILASEVVKLRSEIESKVREGFDGHKAFVFKRGKYDREALEIVLSEFKEAGWGLNDRADCWEFYNKG